MRRHRLDEEDEEEFPENRRPTHNPVPFPPPSRREKRDEAIERANKSERVRESDLRQFVRVLEERDKEIDELEEKVRGTEQREAELRSEIRRLNRLIEASQSASALKSVKDNVEKMEVITRDVRYAMERA